MSDLPIPDPTAAIPQSEHAEPLDIQHDTDPADDTGHARRTPHLGHAILFFSLLLLSLVLAQAVALLASGSKSGSGHPFLTTLSLVGGYIVALSISAALFPLLWHRSFAAGIHWTLRAAHLRWGRLVLIGFMLNVFAVQVGERLIHSKTESDLEHLFSSPGAAWLLAIAGTFLIPAVEEIAFRGFLLPALAIAYDWLSLKRTPAARAAWQSTTALSLPALVFGTIFSSVAFASLHGAQIHWARGPLAILFFVSLVLSAVRLRTRSVACSALVHATYNGTIFLAVAVATHGYRNLDRIRLPH